MTPINLLEEFGLTPDFTWFIRERATGHILVARSSWFAWMPSSEGPGAEVLGMYVREPDTWGVILLGSSDSAYSRLTETESQPYFDALRAVERVFNTEGVRLWQTDDLFIIRTGTHDAWELMRIVQKTISSASAA